MKNQNIKLFFVGLAVVLILILIWVDYFNTKIRIFLLIILLILLFFLFRTISLTLSPNISKQIGKITQSILIISLCCIIILTLLLVFEGIGEYFSSIYILLGSIIVAVLGLYLNNELNEGKEKRKTKRILLALNVTILENENASNKYLLDIENIETLKELKIGFWDTFNASIIDVDLDPKIVKYLLSIKELTLEINQKIIRYNKLIETPNLFNYPYQNLTKLVDFEEVLKQKFISYIQYSKEYQEMAEELYSIKEI